MPKKVLIFIDGSSPSAADRALAEKLGTKMFRNGQQTDDRPEKADVVAAVDEKFIPKIYRDEALLPKGQKLPQFIVEAVKPASGGTSGSAGNPPARLTEENSVAELKEACDAANIAYPASATKARLLELLYPEA